MQQKQKEFAIHFIFLQYSTKQSIFQDQCKKIRTKGQRIGITQSYRDRIRAKAFFESNSIGTNSTQHQK